ncbi:MAG: aromatic ring-hydroxylating dioxygenase subunit alpha [Candidatus Obscuribacterales bacterium]|nr:aromatic ring-hydroxylating dioxygenase subunit alpha [Candidatus Obscuribacterales bacterium]
MEFCKGWYAILSSRELKSGKPFAFKRLGFDLVAWRDEFGKAVIMHDYCPHRSAKLSLGKIESGKIVCPFHGFEFGSDGACLLVPETRKSAPNLSCSTFKSQESNGFVWLWFGDDNDIPAQHPWFEQLQGDFPYSEFQSQWRSHITRCIENQLDYAHLPYVHASTIGGGFDVAAKERKFELEDYVITMRMDKSLFQFKFPNVWLLEILPGKFYQFVAFVPVDEENTIIYARAYQKFVTAPFLRDLLGLIMRYQSGIILNQDKRVVVSQPISPSTLATTEKLYPSDAGIAHFRKRWSECSIIK